MRIFLSWSGVPSRRVAEALAAWIRDVIIDAEPWVSSDDIPAGSRWSAEVGRELDAANIGILCLTRENVGRPWINYEAGALSKRLDSSRVIPLLIDLRHDDLRGPLEQFQCVDWSEDGVRRLVTSIRLLSPSEVQSVDHARRAFDAWWPRLEPLVDDIRESLQSSSSTVEGLDHVSIPVRDLAESITFYHDVLGLPLADNRPHFYRDGVEILGEWLRLPDGREIHLVVNPNGTFPPAREADKIDFTDVHFALRVENIDGVLARLKDVGLKPTINGEGTKWFTQTYVNDPNDHIIELNSRRD